MQGLHRFFVRLLLRPSVLEVILVPIAPDARRRKPPCGESYLQPGETCDICGAGSEITAPLTASQQAWRQAKGVSRIRILRDIYGTPHKPVYCQDQVCEARRSTPPHWSPGWFPLGGRAGVMVPDSDAELLERG